MEQSQIQSQKLIPGKTVCRIVGFQRTKLNCLVKEKKISTTYSVFTNLCPMGCRRSKSMD